MNRESWLCGCFCGRIPRAERGSLFFFLLAKLSGMLMTWEAEVGRLWRVSRGGGNFAVEKNDVARIECLRRVRQSRDTEGGNYGKFVYTVFFFIESHFHNAVIGGSCAECKILRGGRIKFEFIS